MSCSISASSLQGLPLEQQLGSAKLVGLVASSALLTHALYREWQRQRQAACGLSISSASSKWVSGAAYLHPWLPG